MLKGTSSLCAFIMRRGKLERKIEVSLIIFSIFAVFQSLKISGNELTPTSPGAFPLFISILLLGFSIWIFIEGSKRDENPSKDKIFTKEIIFIIILLLLYSLLLEIMGFEMATLGFLFLSINYLTKSNTIRNLFISLLTIGIIIIVFKIVFKVILP